MDSDLTDNWTSGIEATASPGSDPDAAFPGIMFAAPVGDNAAMSSVGSGCRVSHGGDDAKALP